MKNLIGLFAAFLLYACANATEPEVPRIPPLRESQNNPPCIEVLCLTDSLGTVVSCDTLACK